MIHDFLPRHYSKNRASIRNESQLRFPNEAVIQSIMIRMAGGFIESELLLIGLRIRQARKPLTFYGNALHFVDTLSLHLDWKTRDLPAYRSAIRYRNIAIPHRNIPSNQVNSIVFDWGTKYTIWGSGTADATMKEREEFEFLKTAISRKDNVTTTTRPIITIPSVSTHIPCRCLRPREDVHSPWPLAAESVATHDRSQLLQL